MTLSLRLYLVPAESAAPLLVCSSGSDVLLLVVRHAAGSTVQFTDRLDCITMTRSVLRVFRRHQLRYAFRLTDLLRARVEWPLWRWLLHGWIHMRTKPRQSRPEALLCVPSDPCVFTCQCPRCGLDLMSSLHPVIGYIWQNDALPWLRMRTWEAKYHWAKLLSTLAAS